MNKSLLMATLSAAMTFPAAAQDWLDSFNDGSAVDGTPVTWTASPAFASAFDVLEGDMVMSIPGGTAPAISSARVSSNFPTGASVRARMTAVNGPGRFTVAFADQATGIQGYVASFSSCGGGRVELFRGDFLGSIVFLGQSVPMPYSPQEEFYVQLDVFNGVVSARVWRPGEPFPAPQISAADATYSAGVASIAIQDFGSGNCIPTGSFSDAGAVIRFAQASSTPLTRSGAGDVTRDGVVDAEDFMLVLAAWGPCPQPCPQVCPADIAPAGGDCTVDAQDFLALLADWG